MIRRTTIDLDQDLLDRAKRALGLETTRSTVEESLRRAAEQAEDRSARRASAQRDFLETLDQRADLEILAGGQMWR